MSLWYCLCIWAANWAGVRARSTRQVSTFGALCCVEVPSLGMCIISQRARFSIDAPHQPQCGTHLGGQPYCMCMVAVIRKDLGGHLVSLLPYHNWKA